MPNVFKRVVSLVIAIMLTSILLVFGITQTAKADPGCRDVLSIFARGSGQAFDDPDSKTFSDEVLSLTPDLSSSYVDLGNIDGNFTIDKGAEYPAAAQDDWLGDPGYLGSVEIGTNELVKYLNERTARCPHEAIVLGGYSQGADVIGSALARQGYGDVNDQARSQIAFVALYGDPRYNGEDNLQVCDKGTVIPYESCRDAKGVLGGRQPYVPADFKGRFKSWCDPGDGVCTGEIVAKLNPDPGTHVSAYSGGIIEVSSSQIAAAAKSKAKDLAVDDSPASISSAPTGVVSWTNGEGLLLHSNGVVATVPEGTKLEIKCQTHDTSVTGPNGSTTLWNKVTYDGKTGFVSDAYMHTGSNGVVADWCLEHSPSLYLSWVLSVGPIATLVQQW